MAVIRGDVAASMLPDAIVLDLGDLARQGRSMMERAEGEAEAIVGQAKIERERLITGAREEGFADGRAEGFAQGLEEGRKAGRAEALETTRQESQRIVEAWSGSIESFETMCATIVAAAREDVVRFAVAFAERVARRTIELDPRAIEPVMGEALALVMCGSRMSVRVCPDDLEIAREVLGPIMDRLGASGDVELIEDAALRHGSCIVRTQAGSIDASIDAMINRMVQLLLPDGRRIEAAPDVIADDEGTAPIDDPAIRPTVDEVSAEGAPGSGTAPESDGNSQPDASA